MIMSPNFSNPTMAAASHIAQFGYRYFRHAEAGLAAILHRLYAAHLERAQMRLAPMPIKSDICWRN
jgi:hypothetical protein